MFAFEARTPPVFPGPTLSSHTLTAIPVLATLSDRSKNHPQAACRSSWIRTIVNVASRASWAFDLNPSVGAGEVISDFARDVPDLSLQKSLICL